MSKLKRSFTDKALGIIVFMILGHIILGSYFSVNTLALKEYDSIEQTYYNQKRLNESLSFSLPEKTKSEQIHLNFTQINESRDFIRNGAFDSDAQYWNAEAEKDINFSWTGKGLENSKCLKLNITGKESNITFRPMNNSQGIENFRKGISEWKFSENETIEPGHLKQEKATQSIDPNKPMDDSGSLMHIYNGTDNVMANSSYTFFLNTSFPIQQVDLSFWYKVWLDSAIIETNKLEMGLYLETPSNKSYLLGDWKKNYEVSSNPIDPSFKNQNFTNFSNLLNKTGNYTLIFYSRHLHSVNSYTRAYFDYIELNITQGYKQINSSQFLSWNQSINFNRKVWKDARLNLTYGLSNKFKNINSSQVFVAFKINNNLTLIDSIKQINQNTWINKTFNISKSVLNQTRLNISMGIYFNKTAYILPNESFSLYFDNISCFIHTNPDPPQVKLAVRSPTSELNETFYVNRDEFGNAFVNISDDYFEWKAGQVYQLNITTNSSHVDVDFILTKFLLNIEKEDPTNENGDVKREEINITLFFFILVLMMILSSYVFVIRLQKRSFINPEYDYIKKFKMKREMRSRVKAREPKKAMTRCSACGKFINKGAAFCEHCGASQ